MENKLAESLASRLMRYPDLLNEVEGLLDEVENKAGQLVTAEEAEAAVIKRTRSIGLRGLNHWAQGEAAKQALLRPAGTRCGVKKKSGG
jgi:hypothetical protein